MITKNNFKEFIMKKNLPNLIGLGAKKAGSTWLYHFLESHPDIYMSKKTKEIYFFNKYYHRGLEWYKSFFPEGYKYKIVGEISPSYFTSRVAPGRIKKTLSPKFIIILRNPVDTFFSHYKFWLQNTTYNGSFQDFLEYYRQSYSFNIYSKNLKKWFKYFNKNKFLIIILEELNKDPEKVIKEMAIFLGVDKAGFDRSLLRRKSNPTKLPRFKKLNAWILKLAHWMRIADMHGAVNYLKKTGIIRVLYSNNAPELGPQERKITYELYKKEIEELEKLLRKDLSMWKEV